jgi:hypothetical protein
MSAKVAPLAKDEYTHLNAYLEALSKLQAALSVHNIHVPNISGLDLDTITESSPLFHLGVPKGTVAIIKGDIYVSLADSEP